MGNGRVTSGAGRRLLIASSGYADIPVIRAAKKLGFYVAVMGRDAGALGIPYADAYYQADNSIEQQVLEAARRFKVDSISPGAAGRTAVTCSYASELMGFDHLDPFETARLLHCKDAFSRFAEGHGILWPRSSVFESPSAALEALADFRLPLVIKPGDSSGGRGVSVVTCPDQLRGAIARSFEYSRNGRIVVQDFVPGSNHGFSCILRRGRVAFYFVDDEYYYINRFVVAGAVSPSSVPAAAVDQLVQQVEKMADLLGLRDGIFHLQFVLRGATPYIVDICRRIPGDLYVSFVQHATGEDYASAIVKSFTGLPFDELRPCSPRGFVTRHVVLSDRNGCFRGIWIDPSIQNNVIEEFTILRPGDLISDFMWQRVAIIFLQYDSADEMRKKNAMIHRLIRVMIEDGPVYSDGSNCARR